MLLIPASHALAANVTNVVLSVISGPPGTAVTITGSGFTAPTFTVTFGVIQVVPSTPIVGGAISTVFAVPTLPRGTYNVTVTAAGDTVNSPSFTITPEISISKSSGVVGDEIHVSGDGFAASSVITILFDSTSITTVNSNVYGAFYDTDLTIPQARAGWHTISARDYIGYSLGVVFIVSPQITLSTSIASVGSTITCSGNGFAASSNISFSLDSTAISGVATTNVNGGFSNTTLTIPAISGGAHTFQARDTSSNSVVANMTIRSVITINPNNGPAGTTITVTGSGFLANGSINITYDGASVTVGSSSVTADSKGSFTTSFKAPSGPSGVHTIIAGDASYTDSIQFTSVIITTVTPTNGAVGTTITASGAGFKAKSPIIISYDGSQAALITTDAIGNFSTTFSALPSSTGTHQITITDQTNTVKFSFNIVPAITVEPTSGFVGSDITVKATGFTANRAITIKYDADQKISSNADQNGTLIAIIKAPPSVGGNHLITVSDGTSTLTTVFAMDAVPPPVASLLVPSSLVKTDKLATFSWQEVTDRSGVTYTLQIATDATFSSLILQKQGLTTPAYTLTEEETLKSVSKKTPYYWRVKAIDAASNESEWSTPSTFYVGFVLAEWAKYVIFGVVAVLFGIVGFLLGRLTGRRTPPTGNAVSP
jgi:hypothetical protein